MKCHPLRWVWGLVPIALFSAVAAMDIRGRVESDLAKRTTEALQNANLGWAKVQFNGRDGIVSGQAEDETEPGKAIQLASNISGVRIFDGQAELLRRISPYTWSATHRDNKLVVSGFVPNEKAHKAVLAAAKSQFPKTEIEDKLQLARGNPPLGEWTDGIKFGLKQLSALNSGRADLSDLDVSLSGEAPSSAVFKDVRTALTTGLPKTLKLAADRVQAPSVSPYTWRAALAGNQVVLTGYVANDKARDELVSHAKKAFGKTAVVDRMEFASGTPEGWEKTALVSLNQLATLQEGTAELKGKDATLVGVAADDALADATKKAFKAQVAPSFKTTENIRSLKPVVSPYVTKIDASATSIDVAGYVPTETERTALLSAVKARFPGRTLNDRLQIAGGEPVGFETCIMSGLGGLSKIGAGRVALSDKSIEITGQTDDDALANALPGDVKAAAKGACETKVAINLDDSKKR
jgi:OmpA-OmpF porin, OOP family